jgi:hypothetical protein
VNPNQNKKTFFFYLSSLHPFIPLSYFFNPNLCSSFISTVIDDVLADLLTLG